jgi:hypothetical protein
VPRFLAEILLAALATAPAVLGALILAAPEVQGDATRVDLIVGSVSRAEAFRLSALLLVVGGVAGFTRAVAVTVLRSGLQRNADRLRRVRVALTTTTVAELQLLLETRLRWASDGRVTMFVPDGDRFVVAARYSPMILYRDEREPHRMGAGCLGRAWESGQEIGDQLPDPRVDAAAWEAAMIDRWGIPPEEVRALVMKPRMIVAVRIDAHGPPRKELGVVVVETDRLRDGERDDRILDPGRVAAWVRHEEDRFVAVLQGSSEVDEPVDLSARGRARAWLDAIVGVSK